MNNILISDLDKKSVDDFTNSREQAFRKFINKPFRKILQIFDNTNIIYSGNSCDNSKYFSEVDDQYIPLTNYNIKPNKHNVIVERYPKLDDDNYIFIGNHTCSEDIEMILGILDRNAHLVLGSIESLQKNPEIFFLWLLSGVIPFDIMDKGERSELIPKMAKVLESNSILIFPEGSHNISPNKLVNNYYSGAVNLAEKTGKKIVLVSYLRDNDNNASYVDVSNPIDVNEIDYSTYLDSDDNYIEAAKAKYLRDQEATQVYHLMNRHFKMINRRDYQDLEEYLRQEKVEDAFKKLGWSEKTDFDAEYLTRKTNSEKEYESVVNDIYNLNLNETYLKHHMIDNSFILKKIDLNRKNVPLYMEEYAKRLVKKK